MPVDPDILWHVIHLPGPSRGHGNSRRWPLSTGWPCAEHRHGLRVPGCLHSLAGEAPSPSCSSLSAQKLGSQIGSDGRR
jgi:hypothetical protein